MLKLDVRRPAAPLAVGETTVITASVGPNRLDRPVTVTLIGSLSPGLSYRDVRALHGGDCAVQAHTFSCALLLGPGARAEMWIRLLPEALSFPGAALQRLTVVSSAAPGNEVTTTLEFDNNGFEADEAAIAMPALATHFLILLALFMFALAAREAERRRHRPGE